MNIELEEVVTLDLSDELLEQASGSMQAAWTSTEASRCSLGIYKCA